MYFYLFKHACIRYCNIQKNFQTTIMNTEIKDILCFKGVLFKYLCDIIQLNLFCASQFFQ